MVSLDHQETETQSQTTDMSDKWYFRYAGAVFMLAMAVVCLAVYMEEVRLRGLGLILFNPIMGVVYIFTALGLAWEVSSIAIIFTIIVAIGYGLFIAIKALPVGFAIIIGAIIIAAAIKFR